jgi:AcrR family transcriptional regulator
MTSVREGYKNAMTVSEVKRADAVANIARILTAAAQLFAEQAIEATAGIGKGTLYRRFPTKGDLCLALLQAQLTTFQTEVSRALVQ